MKKLLLLFTLSFATVQIKTTFFNSIKETSNHFFSTSKATLFYVWSFIRESNDIKIKKAFESKEFINQLKDQLQLEKNHNENQVLQNVLTMGFDKSNALNTINLLKYHFNTMQTVVSRYSCVMTPWNNTEEMMLASKELEKYIAITQKMLNYFEKHRDCLKGWQTIQQYLELCSLELNDQKQVLQQFEKWFPRNEKFHCLKGVDILIYSAEWSKKLFLNQAFKNNYPQVYDQLYSLFPTLILFIEAVKKTPLYESQQKAKNKEISG
ncbi:hypothetical protein HYV11_03785 [Candidatus Dependentiae bacterium]|nr:hypothetical protein [Candidatus Dependentiae bacterium]